LGTRCGREFDSCREMKSPDEKPGLSILSKANMRYASATDTCITHDFRK
jgi:hypothetical protein